MDDIDDDDNPNSKEFCVLYEWQWDKSIGFEWNKLKLSCTSLFCTYRDYDDDERIALIE